MRRLGSVGSFNVRARLLAAAFSCIFAGCGITQPKYIDYQADDDDDGGETDSTDSEACVAAQTAFDENIEPAIEATCATSSCHLTTTIAGSKLSASDSAANRKQLKAYTGTSATKLNQQLDGSHSGGPAARNALTTTAIDAWIEKEPACG